METKQPELTLRRIFIFWVPLAATWLMMSTEGPFLSAIIARLAEPKYNLAAYGVAFAFALIIESPIIMIMSASTKLVRNGEAYRKLRNFTHLLNGLITVAMLICIFPPVFHKIAYDMIGLPPPVAELTHWAFVVLLPWPGAIGFRRFYQGIMIRNNRTRLVAYGTVVRLVTMTLTALGLYFFSALPGAVIGAAALSAGVTLEALASRVMAHSIVNRLMAELRNPGTISVLPDLSYRQIARFYYPLALTPIIAMGTHPLVTFFMGQGRFAIESLAVYPVIHSLVFIFRSMGLSFMEVVITLLGEENEGRIPLRNFALIVGGVITAMLTLIAFTPLNELWFHHISGLSRELTAFARTPTRLFVLMPALSVLMSMQRGTLVNNGHNTPISWATVLEVGSIVAILILTINYLDWVGAVAAVTAIVLGRVFANAYLALPYFRAMGAKG